jgi:mannosyl-oligosaccharide alpha-1,2-mannosidase
LFAGIISLGALGDSFYEYLLKVWLLFQKTKPQFKEMYYSAADAIHHYMIDKVPERGWIFPAELHNNKKYRKVDHLVMKKDKSHAHTVHKEFVKMTR